MQAKEYKFHSKEDAIDEFIDALQDIRLGNAGSGTLSLFSASLRELQHQHSINSSELVSRMESLFGKVVLPVLVNALQAIPNDSVEINFLTTLLYSKCQISKDAFERYKMVADSGDNLAKCDLGIIFYKGLGVDQDYEQALKYLTSAANRGYVLAQFYLGTMYYKGEGVDQSYIQALKYYKKAAKNGHVEAQENIARLFEENPTNRDLGSPLEICELLVKMLRDISGREETQKVEKLLNHSLNNYIKAQPIDMQDILGYYPPLSPYKAASEKTNEPIYTAISCQQNKTGIFNKAPALPIRRRDALFISGVNKLVIADNTLRLANERQKTAIDNGRGK